MRSDSIYERYRERLNVLVEKSWSRKIIDVAVQRWPDWDHSFVWKRSFGRLNPGGSPYAAVLYEHPQCSRNICFVEIFDDRPLVDRKTIQYFDSSLGWLQLRRFPDDPCLTKLAGVLEDVEDLEVLRYRPYKRCTFRVSKSDRSGQVFGKMFADKRGEQIYRESIALWEAANDGQLQFAVAEPMAWDPSTDTLWQQTVPGESVIDQLFSSGGSRIAECIGNAAASLTQSRLKPILKFGGAEQLERTTKYASELSRQMPDLANKLNRILDKLEKNHRLTDRPPKPLHGAPHPHQWLISEQGLGLVDFDRVCVGDPEMDAATFIAEMDFEDAEKIPVDEINGSFLEAYQKTAGSLDSCLLQTYRCHKHLAKALKAVRSIKSNGDCKARRYVEFVEKVVGSEWA